MSLFSKQAYRCCMCGVPCERTCHDGNFFERGVCSMRCFSEKQWRETLSIMNQPYREDPRAYDDRGYPIEAPKAHRRPCGCATDDRTCLHGLPEAIGVTEPLTHRVGDYLGLPRNTSPKLPGEGS